MDVLVYKWIHILAATILFGTGLGSAFYLFVANKSRNLAAIGFATRWVVIADWLFTTPAFLIQIVTGYILAARYGYELTEPWLIAAYLLILLAGFCWLPVLWIQYRLRNLARDSLRDSHVLPSEYWKLSRIWVGLGVIAFAAFVVIFYLMVFRPEFY
jgi:uncharacterized membrane protein